MRKIISFVLSLIIVGSVFTSASVVAYALNESESNNSITEADSISFSTTINGIMTSGDRDYYKIDLTSSGRITIQFNSFMQYYGLNVFNSDAAEQWATRGNEWVSTTGKRSDTYNMDFEAGTYYIQVNGFGYVGYWSEETPSTGTYNFTVSFTTSDANKAEPNNSIAQAKGCSFDSIVKGQIAINDRYDYYSVILPSSGRINLKLNSFMQYYSVYIYDSDGIEQWATRGNEWVSTTGKRSDTYNMDFEAGTYYIQVNGFGYVGYWSEETPSTGTYNFTVSFSTSDANKAEPNNSVAQANEISFDSIVKGQIAVNDSVDYYSFTLPTSGRVTIKFNSFMQYYCVLVFDIDGKEIWYDDYNEWVSTTQKRSDTLNIDLEAGNYYLQVNGYCNGTSNKSTGTYNFAFSFITSAANKAEPNDSIADAKAITFDSVVKGQIAINDRYDYYSFSLPTEGNIDIDFESFMQYYCIIIYDSDGIQTWYADNKEWNAASSTRKDKHIVNLTKGTYYMQVNGYRTGYQDASTGNYNYIVSSSVKVTNVTLSLTSANIISGMTEQLTATISPTNATNKSITWTSSNTSVATVSSTGFVTAKAVGKATITCTANDGSGITATCAVTVVPVILSGIAVKTNPTKTSYFVGDTLNTSGLSLTASYSNGTTQTITSGFTCSPTTLSTVGTQTITVTYNGKTTSFNVTVSPIFISGIKLNATSASIIIGTTKQLTATVSPSNAANKAVTWSSSNTSVAMVSTSGVVTAKAVGRATITCKAKDGSGKKATCVITVIPKTPTNVKAASASYNSIKISWTAVSGATGYYVYRATSKTGTYTNLGSVTSASFVDKKAATGTTYYYKVRAYKTVNGSNIYSAYSAIVSAKAVPAVPTSFTAAKASTTSIKTTWKAVTGATGYEVWMATSSNGTYSKLTTTTKTTYTKTSLTKNKTYYFKVRAYKTVNDKKVYGAFTAIKSAKPS